MTGEALMLLPLILLLICILGFLAQTTGLCMVRGVAEWKAGNKEVQNSLISLKRL